VSVVIVVRGAVVTVTGVTVVVVRTR
jgi:hypothetical protein